MKKFLSSVLCICILLSSISSMTFAVDSGATLAVNCVSSCEAGDTVTVTVDLSDAVDYAGVSCRLNYDSSLMSVVADSAACGLTGGQVSVNENLANQIHVSYARTTNTSVNGNLLTVQFKMKEKVSGNASFTLSNVKLYDENSSAMPISAEGATMTVTYDPPTILPQAASTTVTTGDTYLVNVDVNKLSDYCGFSFRVQYDSAKFDIVSIAQGAAFSGTLTGNTEYSANEAFVSYAVNEPTSTSGTVCTITFTAKHNVSGDAAFKVTNVQAFDVNSAEIDCIGGETSVNVVCSHNGVEWKVETPADCTEDGTKTFNCACGFSDTDVIEAPGHSYDKEVVPPTESTAGYTKYTCSACGDTYTEAGDPATGYTITYNANGGTFTVTSQNKAHDVNLVLTSEVPTRDGHNFLGWAETSTATAAEYVAGATYSKNESTTLYAVWEEVVEETLPTFARSMQAYLSLKNEVYLVVCFKFDGATNAEMIKDIDKVGLLVWDNDKLPEDSAAIYSSAKTVVTDVEFNSSLGRFEAKCPGIPAKNLGDQIAFRPYYVSENGTYVYGRIISNYSPKTYCYGELKKDDEKLQNLMISILNYGASAQKYFNYRTSDLMNANLTEEQQTISWDGSLVRSDWSIPEAKEGALTRNKTVFTSRGGHLTLLGAIDYTYYVKVATVSVKTIKMLCWDETAYNSAEVLTRDNASLIADMKYVSANSRYEYTYKGLPAKNMFSPIYACAEVTDTNGSVYYSGVVAYCPERFSYISQNDSNANLANLARCITIYGDAARKYFG